MTTPVDGPVEVFIGFTRALRAAGLPIDHAHAFVEAVAHLDAGSRSDVYWSGRATLCAGPDDLEVYDAVFDRWFSTDQPRPHDAAPTPPRRLAPTSTIGDDDADRAGDDRVIAVVASTEEHLRHRDVGDLTTDERRHLAHMFSRLDARLPMRSGRRRRPHRRGEIDPGRTVRDQLRRAGEPGPMRHRRPRPRPRRVVFLIDVSGSMEPYADSLLRLAHRVVMAAPRSTEVFTIGTRLTRVTTALRIPDAEKALDVAGRTVPDWSGGTRLGEVLRAFLDRWGQRGVARGAVVVIASDGWERGDPEQLGEQVERLSRLAHAVVWANPHRGRAGYAPIQGGIAAVLPHIDGLVAGHSFAAFADLLEMVADA
ncbi:vWA domain-containing protein [Aeromicrobium sp.]|uniref:vWA domain-containing protein n=1 Tax=Aeromicrobium sp. TaxID=1871063 RepID=UPI003D6B13AD